MRDVRQPPDTHLPNPYAAPKPKPLSLEERQVRALERIARALEGHCSTTGSPTAGQ
jgi:hypothetical protein